MKAERLSLLILLLCAVEIQSCHVGAKKPKARIAKVESTTEAGKQQHRNPLIQRLGEPEDVQDDEQDNGVIHRKQAQLIQRLKNVSEGSGEMNEELMKELEMIMNEEEENTKEAPSTEKEGSEKTKSKGRDPDEQELLTKTDESVPTQETSAITTTTRKLITSARALTSKSNIAPAPAPIPIRCHDTATVRLQTHYPWNDSQTGRYAKKIHSGLLLLERFTGKRLRNFGRLSRQIVTITRDNQRLYGEEYMLTGVRGNCGVLQEFTRKAVSWSSDAQLIQRLKNVSEGSGEMNEELMKELEMIMNEEEENTKEAPSTEKEGSEKTKSKGRDPDEQELLTKTDESVPTQETSAITTTTRKLITSARALTSKSNIAPAPAPIPIRCHDTATVRLQTHYPWNDSQTGRYAKKIHSGLLLLERFTGKRLRNFGRLSRQIVTITRDNQRLYGEEYMLTGVRGNCGVLQEFTRKAVSWSSDIPRATFTCKCSAEIEIYKTGRG